MGKKKDKGALILAVVILVISALTAYLEEDEVSSKHTKKRKGKDESAMLTGLKETLADNVPVESAKEIRPKFYLYLIGAGSFITMGVVFLYYFIILYQRNSTSSFVSISENSGSCKAVTKSVVGTFVADESGHWDGNSAYRFSEGVYELIATEAKWTNDEYRQIVDVFVDQLHVAGTLAASSDLAANVALIMSWQMLCPAELEICEKFTDQYFVFTGSSQYIFDLSHIHSSFSNRAADCLVTSSTSYDLPSATNTVAVNYEEFIGSSACNSTLDPLAVGYDPSFQQADFKMVLDVRTFGDSVGINNGALPVLDIEVVAFAAPDKYFYYQNNTYVGNFYIDSYYNGMKPLFCIYNEDHADLAAAVPPIVQLTPDGTGVVQMCFIVIGDDIVSLPLFFHYGASGSGESVHEPTKSCFCDNPSADAPECSMFNFMSSYVFFPDMSSLQAQVELLLDMVVKAGGFDKLSRSAYNASFASASAVFTPNTDPIMTDPAWRSDAYAFCNHACSMLVVNGFGDSVSDQVMTAFMYPFQNGSCNDVFSVPPETHQNLLNEAPTLFTERYFECVMIPADAINESIGLASGNATTLVPIAFLILLPLVYIFLHLTNGMRHADPFSPEDVRDTVKVIALGILETRESISKAEEEESDEPPVDEAAPLVRLVREMNHLRECEHGIVDSDDSGDEEAFVAPAESVNDKLDWDGIYDGMRSDGVVHRKPGPSDDN